MISTGSDGVRMFPRGNGYVILDTEEGISCTGHDIMRELTCRVPSVRTTLPMEMPGTASPSRWPRAGLTDGVRTVSPVSRELPCLRPLDQMHSDS